MHLGVAVDQRPATSNQPPATDILRIALPVTLSGCGGNVNLFGIYFAPWMACVAGGALLGYVATRLLERHVFDYDPRYFAWAFLALTILFAFGFWFAAVRN